MQSTLLLTNAFDHEFCTLEVEFVDGSAFRFYAVPKRHWGDLLSAFSKGQYFRTHIQGKYRREPLR